jgi:phage portal protein BeeE
VPPMMLGIPGDNTYSNYQEANRSFWRATAIPLATRAAKMLTQWLTPAFGLTLRLVPNTDDIDALAADRQAQWDRINSTKFLTINEMRAATGYEPLPDGDVIMLTKGASLVSLKSKVKADKNGTQS